MRVYDPMLAVAWGPRIQLVQVSLDPKQPIIKFVSRSSHCSDACISGMDWLGQRVLLSSSSASSEDRLVPHPPFQVIVFLNIKDQLRVFDPFALEEIETMDAKALTLIYHTRLSKADSYHHSFRAHKVSALCSFCSALVI